MTENTIHFGNPRLLNQLYAGKEENLLLVEKTFNVKLTAREDWINIQGAKKNINNVKTLFEMLQLVRTQGLRIKNSDFIHILTTLANGKINELYETFKNPLTIRIKNKSIIPKTINQKRYLEFINNHDIVFGIGPAGTGKTYLAVAAAIEALIKNNVERIILTRPAVEAGEALGFLPGDLKEKILPYLHPLYDAMYDILGLEETNRLIEKNIIEIAPLAYMRGRTLSNAFVILDEAQNTTPAQMMMFLTRLGDESKMIITGDITQVDLPKPKTSGLKQSVQVLSGISGIKLFYFESKDVVRHPLVQKIIDAYERFLIDKK